MSSDLSSATETSMPVIGADPFALDVLRDPVLFNRALLDAGPIVWLSAHQTYGVGRYAETTAVLKDWEGFTSSRGAGLSDITKPGSWRIAGPIVEVDPPLHTQARAALTKILSPRVIRSWKDSFEIEAEKLCDEVLKQTTEFDAVRVFTEAFVHTVFPRALGIRAVREQLVVVGNHNFNSIGPPNEIFHKSQERQNTVADWFEHCQTREAMLPGGFGELIFAAEDDGALAQGTASPMLRTMLRGGMDTTISGLGSTFRFLAEHPEQWNLVQADPNLVRAAFDEALRLDPPARTFYRTTPSRSVDFAGRRLRPDTKVQVFPGAANRDPRKWSKPDEFDLTRKAVGHLAFGYGIHNCIGQVIARMEAECLLGSFVRRVATLELADEPQFVLNNSLRTLESLPVRVTLK